MITPGIIAHKQRDVGLAMLIDTNTTGAESGSSTVVNMPTNVSGDILLALYSNNTYTTGGVSLPSGWTELEFETGGAGGDDCSAGAAYKVSDGSEPSTFTVTWSTPGNQNIAAVHSVRNGQTPLSNGNDGNKFERFYGDKITFLSNAHVIGFMAASRGRNAGYATSGKPAALIFDVWGQFGSSQNWGNVIGHQEYDNANQVGVWAWSKIAFRNYVPRCSVAILSV